MPSLFVSIAFLATAALAAEPQSAKLLNLRELVQAQDYPLVALQNEQQGTVTLKLRVDSSGYVTSCKVAETSGHVALDEQSCTVFRARARFEPAKDRKGRPVEEDYFQRVTWKLAPDTAPKPLQAWMLQVAVGFNADGAIVSCETKATGLSEPPRDCEALKSAAGDAFADEGGPAKAFAIAISEVHFYPVSPDSVPAVPRLTDATQVGQQISRVTIGPGGDVSECEGIRYSGAASPASDACQIIRMERFDAAPANGKPTAGTVVTTAYVRNNVIT